MGRIKLLDQATANGIAAGEVVERPASVIKELVENSLDAGATVITVEIIDGGIKLMRVTDNGCGMDSDDAVAAFSCHATSKLSQLSDLESLSTMGFRGEALSSISAVSKVVLRSRQVGDEFGTTVIAEAGKIIKKDKSGGVWGTCVEIRDLFYNFPARYKFLKKDQTEAQYITLLCERFVLIRPDVSFRLTKNDKEILHSPGNNDPVSALYCVYGKDVVSQSIVVRSDFEQVKVRGFVGRPTLARSGRSEQTVFVNDRIIRSKTISAAIDEAYKTLLMKGKYAFVVLMIYVPSALVDVNVHPQKSEVRFWNDSEVFRAVYHSIRGVLMSESLVEEGSEKHEKVSTQSDFESIPTVVQPTISFRPVTETSHEKSKYPFSEERETFNSQTNASDDVSVQQDISTLFSRPQTNETNAMSRSESLQELANARYIGSLFSTYLLFESDHNLIVMDQHAAHEKILFEKLLHEKARRGDTAVSSQKLLSPVVISMSLSDMMLMEDNLSRFNDIGFELDRIGEREYAVRYAPLVCDTKTLQTVIQHLIDQIKNDKNKSDDGMLLALATSACKAAVKAHDRLDPLEVRSLIDALIVLENPYSCPHGRPTFVYFSKKYLEKEFKRII